MATVLTASQQLPSAFMLGTQPNGSTDNNGALKALLAEPVEFRELAKPSAGESGAIDPKGRGWIEVNPLPVASGVHVCVP